jgi:hypothetical protein
MKETPADLVLERLQQLQGYVCNADEHIFWDRLVDSVDPKLARNLPPDV